MKEYSKPGFPASQAWKSMQDVLDKEMPIEQKRKKRFAFFWLFPLLIAGGAMLLYTNKHSDINKMATNAVAEENISNPKQKVKQTTSNKLNGNEQVNVLSANSFKESDLDENVKIDNSNIINGSTYSNTNKRNSFDKSQANKHFSINNNNLSNKSNLEKQFAGRASFSDLRAMKIDRGEASNSANNFASTLSVSTNNSFAESNDIVENSTKIETAKPSLESSINSTMTKTPVKVPKSKIDKNLHYGLQWNALLPQANNYLDYNAKNQPLSFLIPEFWVSKNVGLNGEIALQLNPYSQYTLHSNNVLASNDYSVSILQGSATSPTTINYIQTRSLLKAMGMELTAKYTYHINNNFSLALGIGNNWLNAAVVNDRVIGKNDKLVHDSLYGIAKGFSDWNYLKSSFLVGRFEMLYQFKKLQVGLAFVKPLGDIYNFSNTNKNPINGRLVLRWKIK